MFHYNTDVNVFYQNTELYGNFLAIARPIYAVFQIVSKLFTKSARKENILTHD